MERHTIAWYYLFFFLLVVTFFLSADFSPINNGLRLFILMLIFAAVVAPGLVYWSGRREHLADQASISLLVSTNHDLEASVKALQIKELERAGAKDDRSELIASTAHQLRTPLSAIKWTLQMMLQEQLGPVSAEQKEYLQKGLDAAGRVIATINEWLNNDVAKNNRDEYKFVKTDLLSLLDEVLAEFRHKLAQTHVRLAVERPDRRELVAEVDPAKFSMVLDNLIDNAIKYSRPKGQIKVKVLTERLNSPKPEVEFVVSDDGIGIPASDHSKIFQRQFRSSNAVEAAIGGSGLGLSISKHVVEMHRGQIWFESQEGKGTTFHVVVPIYQNKV